MMDTDRTIKDYLLLAVGAYLEAHTDGRLTDKDLRDETLETIDKLGQDMTKLLWQDENDNTDGPKGYIV